MIRFFESLGQSVIAILDYIGGLALLLWEALGYMLAGGLRWSLAIYQMAFLGVNSIMIVLLTTTFAGMVISLQLAHVAVTYGVSNIVGGGVALAMARELGPMLTAVVVAGRAGSAITAEIGSMKVTEQIDALICMAVSPVKFLVCPRIVALVLMMPLLTLFSDMAGLVGGGLRGRCQCRYPPGSFLRLGAPHDRTRRRGEGAGEIDDLRNADRPGLVSAGPAERPRSGRRGSGNHRFRSDFDDYHLYHQLFPIRLALPDQLI
jgi:ABC transport permease subunit